MGCWSEKQPSYAAFGETALALLLMIEIYRRIKVDCGETQTGENLLRGDNGEQTEGSGAASVLSFPPFPLHLDLRLLTRAVCIVTNK